MNSAENSNVQVVVRLRPSENAEDELEDVFAFDAEKPEVITIKDPLSKGRSDHTFLFNKVLLPHVKQETVFQEV